MRRVLAPERDVAPRGGIDPEDPLRVAPRSPAGGAAPPPLPGGRRSHPRVRDQDVPARPLVGHRLGARRAVWKQRHREIVDPHRPRRVRGRRDAGKRVDRPEHAGLLGAGRSVARARGDQHRRRGKRLAHRCEPAGERHQRRGGRVRTIEEIARDQDHVGAHPHDLLDGAEERIRDASPSRTFRPPTARS